MDLVENKAAAWNIIGESFWKIGHTAIRVEKKIIESLLDDIKPHQSVCVLGASGTTLIDAVLRRNLNLTVIDFSQAMNDALRKHIGERACNIQTHDIIREPIQKIARSFDYVISDQMINCFAHNEVPIFFQNIYDLLNHTGELRTIIKVGYYQIDLALMEQGQQNQTLHQFYNPIKNTIHYEKAGTELMQIIDDPAVLEWYKNRGEEVRFPYKGFIQAVSRFIPDNLKSNLKIVSATKINHFINGKAEPLPEAMCVVLKKK